MFSVTAVTAAFRSAFLDVLRLAVNFHEMCLKSREKIVYNLRFSGGISAGFRTFHGVSSRCGKFPSTKCEDPVITCHQV